MVPGFDLFLADTLRRLNGRAGGVCSGWRRQGVVERFDRILELRVVEEPREVLRVTLRQLNGQARGHTTNRGATSDGCRAAGRLDIRHRRTTTDDADVGEDRFGDDLGLSRCGSFAGV